MLVAGMALVVGGPAVLAALVLGALGPQLADLERIGGEHARAVTAALHLRERLEALQRDARRPVGVASEAGIREQVTALEESAAALESLCKADAEVAALQRVRAGLRRVSTVTSRLERAGTKRSRADAGADDLGDPTAQVARASDDLVRLNVDEVRAAAADVHRALVRLMSYAAVLALLGMVGALLLLRQALRAVDAHEALVERHEAELAAFASRAAHELRTPLHTIGLALHVLRKHPGELTALDRAEASARRLAQTIEDILRFSRSGGAPEPGGVSDVGGVVEVIAAELEPRAAEAGLALVTDAPRGLEVAMAEGHLHTVLQNLVENALKYGRSVGGRVTVRASGGASRVALTVADTGPGIPQRALSRIFEPFFRGTSEGAGYGLGLATVKRLVEAHGGHVRVESAPGAGTTITVELPLPGARHGPDSMSLP